MLLEKYILNFKGLNIMKTTPYYLLFVQDFDGYFNEDIDLGKNAQGNYILYVVQAENVFSHNIILN